MLNNETITCTASTQKEINNHTGYTPSNLFKLLSSVNARIANTLSVGVHMIVSHKVKKIQNIMRAFEIDKKIISARIFLFSVLFILEKNNHKQIREAINNPTKWKLKFWGLNIANRSEIDEGK